MENIHHSWKPLFDSYKFNLNKLYSKNIVFPPIDQIFRVFSMDVKEIRVLLLGQDPYHNDGQAHGLSFSVETNIKIPPSLKNIFKEINNTFPERNYIFTHGNLERWFNEEKIFLLNASLTVIKNKPGCHMTIWSSFTNNVIKFISDNNNKCVFLLLGNPAKNKAEFITDKTRIVKGVHPSPLSASQGFFNSNVFKSVEDILKEPIDWTN